MSRKNVTDVPEDVAVNRIAATTRQLEREEKRIYIGPSLKGIVHGTVFQSGLSSALEEMIRKMPVVAELVVPVSRLQKANRELADPGSAMSRFFKIAEDYRKGEE